LIYSFNLNDKFNYIIILYDKYNIYIYIKKIIISTTYLLILVYNIHNIVYFKLNIFFSYRNENFQSYIYDKYTSYRRLFNYLMIYTLNIIYMINNKISN